VENVSKIFCRDFKKSLLYGLIKPDAGRIEMRGRVGTLIALGAGFNPLLSDRENIYVSGSVLGLACLSKLHATGLQPVCNRSATGLQPVLHER
jgi:hypothetical protein